MEWKNLFQKMLLEDFESAQKRNPRFSLRSYAKQLGAPVSALSEALRGRVLMKPERAAQYVLKFTADQHRKDLLFALMGFPEKVPQGRFIDVEKHPLLGHWEHSAVLHFFDLDIEDKSTAMIARRLHLTEGRVQQVLEELNQAGLLRKSDEMIPETPVISAKEKIVQDQDSLNLIRRFIEKQGAKIPLMTTTTFVGSRTQIEEIQREIERMHGRLAAMGSEAVNHDEIFRLSICLLPFSHLLSTES